MNQFENTSPTPESNSTEESAEKQKKLRQVITAKGSIYEYLPDGRTQRFQTIEGIKHDPQDALVFVPDYEWVKKNASPGMLNILGETPAQYNQTLLEYAQGKGKKCYIIDQRGMKLDTNALIAEAEGAIFLAFGDGEKIDFSIPVSRKPKLGYYTFDTRIFEDEEGRKRERHLGNRVIEIIEE